MKLFVLAALFAVFAFRNVSHERRSSWLLLALPVVFALLSLDEVAQLHERLGNESDRLLPEGDRTTTPFSQTGIWAFLVGIPFLFMMLGLLYALRSYLRPTPAATRKFLVGITIFVLPAAGGDLVENFSSEGSWASTLGISVEEVGEMLGVTIMIWASLELLQTYRLRVGLGQVRAEARDHP